MPESTSLFDSSLLVRHDIGRMPELNAAFIEQSKNTAHVAAQLLLYDQLIIPTHDYGIVAALINWMGPDLFLEALDLEAFCFIRTKDLIGYAGNGLGLAGYVIGEGSSPQPFTWWQTALFKEPTEALAEQIKHTCPLVRGDALPALVDRILKCCHVATYDNDTFLKHIVHETYTGIIESPKLSSLVRAREALTDSKINLERLPGIDPNQMRMGIRNEDRDAIDLVLRVAELHRDLVLAASFPTADVLVPGGTEQLIAQKVARLKLGSSVNEGFTRLLDLHGLPDVESAIVAGRVHFIDIWGLRQRREAIEFRKWLAKAAPADSRELQRLYVQAIGSADWVSSLPGRTMRFLMTTAAGILSPAVGLVVGAADTFLMERWLGGYTPRFFFNRYEDLFR